MKRKSYIPELDGYRVLLIFIVSWYHIWQQSWWTPYIGSYSLDFMLRSGYAMVDGTMVLSAFLLFLPWVRAYRNGSILPDRKLFYRKRAARILPSYYFILLVVLFSVVLPWSLYYTPQYAVKDLFTHATFLFTFWADTYIGTPLGVACWTLCIEVHFYLAFPYLARWFLKRPAVTFFGMTLTAFAFRSWCIWSLYDFSMVVNQGVAFLDAFALGMAGAMIYASIEQVELSGGKKAAVQTAATLLLFAAFKMLELILRSQSAENGQAAIQQGQMIRRFPLCCVFLLIILCLPKCIKPIRLLFGNPVTRFLGTVSMNYYLIHQTVAVHLKRIGFPPSESEMPNMVSEMPWQRQYTFLCFGLSLLLAILITYLIEKPVGKWLLRKRTMPENGETAN